MQQATQPKINITPFPNCNNAINKTLASTNAQPKELSPKATAQDKDDDSLLVFEMLLALKEQLDSIQTQLSSLSKQSKQ